MELQEQNEESTPPRASPLYLDDQGNLLPLPDGESVTLHLVDDSTEELVTTITIGSEQFNLLLAGKTPEQMQTLILDAVKYGLNETEKED